MMPYWLSQMNRSPYRTGAPQWTRPYSQWGNPEFSSAQNFIQSNWGTSAGKQNIFNAAKNIGLNQTNLADLINQYTGAGIQENQITQFGDQYGLGRLKSSITGLPVNEVADRTFPSGSPFEQYAWYASRGVSLPSNFGAPGVVRPYSNYREGNLASAISQGYNPGQSPLYRWMRQNNMIGGTPRNGR